MMAMQADSSALSPEVVGNAFVEQYYSILCQSPDNVHRFYQESNMLSRPDPSEPIHAPNKHAVNHNSPTPANEGTENGKEVSHPLDNGKVLVAEKVVVPEHPIISSQNDAPPVTKTLASKTQDEVPKKSFASVVHDLKKSNSPFDVVLRVPPVKLVEQSRVTAAAAIETAPNSNSSVDKNNNNAGFYFISSTSVDSYLLRGTPYLLGTLLDTATIGQLKQTGNCFGFVEFESASSVQSVLKASPISIGNQRASIEIKRESIVTSTLQQSPDPFLCVNLLSDLIFAIDKEPKVCWEKFARYFEVELKEVKLRDGYNVSCPLVTFLIVYYRRNDVYDQFLATPNFLNEFRHGWLAIKKTYISQQIFNELIFSHGLTDASVEAFRDCALQPRYVCRLFLLGEYPGVKDSWMDVIASQGSSLLSVDLCGSDVTDSQILGWIS
ncbi:hypothetical protein Patl1_03217 [Pistacia atlantica]|uniref:Uncharacterized protein n=1 Tax=Pistacia atlantica TaxID=434234 RepID=A0ACC1CA58_9ROSI|nr:hypothetical protein Patl1_03217 [Pistacia atlantica]